MAALRVRPAQKVSLSFCTNLSNPRRRDGRPTDRKTSGKGRQQSLARWSLQQSCEDGSGKCSLAAFSWKAEEEEEEIEREYFAAQ